MKTIYLVRHCKAEGQAPAARLTSIGTRQAEELAEFFTDKQVDAIIASPYERAHSSIKPTANRLGLTISLEERLKERVLAEKDLADWLDKLRATYDDLDICYEGGESSRTAMNRAVRVVQEALASQSQSIILVSHGNLLSLLLKHFDSRIGFKEWSDMSNPDVFELTFSIADRSTLTDFSPSIKRIWAG
ncbi:histidine phosphatase family protein [Paenibacillus senegalensis]|uniref:histidine phosphatase family protein n=1 Tax=Paenibacillus senegalensis TaxID=1465766 RepID=UPI000289CE60|nr:histidine phosphatase family protein [Paenibacillus senegalensis]